MDIRRVVGKNVQRYRIEAELSQKEFAAGMVAEALGVRPAALFRARVQSSKATQKTRKPIIQI